MNVKELLKKCQADKTAALTTSDETDPRKGFSKAIDPVVDPLCEKYNMVGSAANK